MNRWPQKHPPGSVDARRAGCSCSPVANAYGAGQGGTGHPIYVVADDCSYHPRDASPARTGGPLP